MKKINELKKEYILPYENLGVKRYSNGTTKYGHVPEVAPQAYLITVFNPISTEELNALESSIGYAIPNEYSSFLMDFSNGLNLFITCFCLYGFVGKINRQIGAAPQPFSLSLLNIYERPKNSKDTFFFIGGYDYDGSKLYIDKQTGEVHYCKKNDSASLYCWKNFEDMLSSEIKRLSSLFDDNGKIKIPYEKTLPII